MDEMNELNDVLVDDVLVDDVLVDDVLVDDVWPDVLSWWCPSRQRPKRHAVEWPAQPILVTG